MPEAPARHLVGKDWSPVRNMRASEEIVESIRKTFFAGMRPGDWLGTEAELAQRFDVSRITIREAVRALETSGVVDVRVGSHGGIRIANPDPEPFVEALAVQLHLLGVTFGEVVQAQLVIEPIATDLAARRATPEDIDRLRYVIDAARAVAEDRDEFTRRAIAFHTAVTDIACNRILSATLMAMRGLQVPKYAMHTHPQRAIDLTRTHERIFHLIANREPEKASAAMRDHLAVVHRKVVEAGEDQACAIVLRAET